MGGKIVDNYQYDIVDKDLNGLVEDKIGLVEFEFNRRLRIKIIPFLEKDHKNKLAN